MSTSFKGSAIVALISVVCLTSLLAFGKEDRDSFQITIAETIDHPLLVLPKHSRMGEASAFGWRISVMEKDEHRIYFAKRGKKLHSYRVLQSQSQNLAFNPTTGRFESLVQSVRVKLRDPDALDRVIEAAEGTGGKAYPQLGFALVHLPNDADPVTIAKRIKERPEVINAWLIVKGPKRVPRTIFHHPVVKRSKYVLSSSTGVFVSVETPHVSVSTDNADHVAGTPAFSNSPTESETTSATIAKSADSLNEWEDSGGVTLTVTLNSAAEENTTVELDSSGTATLGSDFDLVGDGPDGAALKVSATETVELVIEESEESATVTVRPIRDLEQEGDETATIAISSVAGNDTNATDTTSVDVLIKDTGRLMLVDFAEENIALIFGNLSLSATSDSVEIKASLTNLGTVASSATT